MCIHFSLESWLVNLCQNAYKTGRRDNFTPSLERMCITQSGDFYESAFKVDMKLHMYVLSLSSLKK